MTRAVMAWIPVLPLLLLCIRHSASLYLPDSKELRQLLSRYEDEASQNGTSNSGGDRVRRAIRWSDREEILQLHNKLRGTVYPTASNMEYMVRHVPSPHLPQVIMRHESEFNVSAKPSSEMVGDYGLKGGAATIKTTFSLCWKHAVMLVDYYWPTVLLFYKEDNNADSVLPAGSSVLQRTDEQTQGRVNEGKREYG